MKRILIVLGGTWHDFDGFARIIGPVLRNAGHSVDTTGFLDNLKTLDQGNYDLALLYTCLTAQREDGSPATNILTDEHALPLARWVSAGGGLLAVHAATVSAQSSPVFRRLVGGAFVKHPPACRFTVHPVGNEHPITKGINGFEVEDELYIEACEPDVVVHAVAIHEEVARPQLWTRTEGSGNVVHVALGHDAKVWSLPVYQRLLLGAVEWLVR
jgi:type 1 glutamine amidotransferase